MCKEGEHALLCPNEKVPCLNAAFGCPIIMPRSWQAGHLQVCPASVVCCSMEWIRWPADEAYANTHLDVHAPTHTLHENLLKEQKAGEQLDLAMALDDQRHLYARMKMKTLYPEMIEKVEGEEEEKKEDKKKEKTEDWATVHLRNGASTLCTGADDGWSEDRPYHILSGNWIFWTNPKCYLNFVINYNNLLFFIITLSLHARRSRNSSDRPFRLFFGEGGGRCGCGGTRGRHQL